MSKYHFKPKDLRPFADYSATTRNLDERDTNFKRDMQEFTDKVEKAKQKQERRYWEISRNIDS